MIGKDIVIVESDINCFFYFDFIEVVKYGLIDKVNLLLCLKNYYEAFL